MIFEQLGFRQKDDLLFMHRYIIAQATKGSFREKARALLMDAIIAEVLASKQVGKRNKRSITDILGEDNWAQVKDVIDLSNPDSAIEKVKRLNLPEETIDRLALYLAKERVKDSLIAKTKGKSL